LIIGALMLGTSLVIALRSFRLSQPADAAQGRAVLTAQYSL